ncbi:hypothetical protein NPIL_419231 [Nephila pilipes]|uniref:Mos1 transposase HTH domain-containing protein n=1 Tax=Nephila pilipes TaxID=299642 RepID=A0A8X6TGL8_NEPPI|nr:hypothetical protein NPIL_419231 [Nephila pilipes]
MKCDEWVGVRGPSRRREEVLSATSTRSTALANYEERSQTVREKQEQFRRRRQQRGNEKSLKWKKEHIRHLLLACNQGYKAPKAARDICAVYGECARQLVIVMPSSKIVRHTSFWPSS